MVVVNGETQRVGRCDLNAAQRLYLRVESAQPDSAGIRPQPNVPTCSAPGRRQRSERALTRAIRGRGTRRGVELLAPAQVRAIIPPAAPSSVAMHASAAAAALRAGVAALGFGGGRNQSAHGSEAPPACASAWRCTH
eukprot:748529-Prymnesium_polylepis.1